MGRHIHFVSFLRRSPWGGSEELYSKAALWLQQHKAQVSVSMKWWPEAIRHPRVSELQNLGVEVSFWGGRYTFLRSWCTQGINRVIQLIGCFPPIHTMAYAVRDADLVVFSSGGNSFPSDPVRTCQQRGQKYVLIIQSVSEATWPRDTEVAEWRAIYQGAEAAFFVSRANRESTVCQLGFDDPKFQVVVNPNNASWETPFTWPADTERAEWAFVGRLEPGHKGVDLLLRAFSRARWRDRAVHLNLYGNGFSEQALTRTKSMLGLDAQVTFRGQVSELDQIWQRNEMLILPSRHEGLPLVVTEAMLYGRPCLVTNVSGNAEQLEDGVTGFLAVGPTVDAVDEALERAWIERHRLHDMGLAAYESIRNRIPRDPVHVFCELLLQAATAPEAEHSTNFSEEFIALKS